MQLLAKFKQILYMGCRATLNFRNFTVALYPMYRICLNFAKSGISSCLSKFFNKKLFHLAVFLKYKCLKLKLRVFLAGYSVAMVTYSVTKTISTCSPIIGQFFDTMIVPSTDKEYPSKSKSWKVLETGLSHLNCNTHKTTCLAKQVLIFWYCIANLCQQVLKPLGSYIRSFTVLKIYVTIYFLVLSPKNDTIC